MASPRTIKTTTEASACEGGSEFDDTTYIKDLQKATISRIVLTFDDFIRSIAVHYANGPGPTRGMVAGTQCEIIMTDGEFITSMKGSIRPDAISHLEFVTNKGKRWGPYGRTNPDTGFCWGELGPRMGLLYLSGRADSHFRGLMATFATYSHGALPPILLRYEKQPKSASEDPQPDVLCTFAQNLMSPNVTLAVGPEAKELQASQGILCRLPFFRAALEGEFREASEKRISMPDDDLRSVSALVEYLYTGHYTYPYHSNQETDSGIPAGDAVEGSFHAVVYATSHKYGCQQLVDASLTSFVSVLAQLNGIEVVRLWVIAYDHGLFLDAVAGDGNMATFMDGLGQLLKELYKTDREEMDSTTVDHPTLIGDLLRLVVS